MRIRRIASSLLAVMSPQLALAQALPTWRIQEICAKESAPGQCALFEGRARNAVSGSWDIMPEAVRRNCLAEMMSPQNQSWRLLGNCIDREALKGVDRRAVATAATPAAPVPAPNLPGPTDGTPAPQPTPPAEPPAP